MVQLTECLDTKPCPIRKVIQPVSSSFMSENVVA